MTTLNLNSLAIPTTTAKANNKPKAQVWLNVGYVVNNYVHEDGTVSDMFVGLASGIPLDQLEDVKTNTSSNFMNQINSAKNNLRDELLRVANTLAAGEAKVISAGQLAIEIRRVKDDVPVSNAANPLIPAALFTF